MTVAAILLAILIITGTILYLHHRLTDNDADITTPAGNDTDNTAADDEQCCGMHITCEKDSLVAGMDRELLYYDDEELDAYRGRDANSYSPAEVEEFREVLLTLQPDDIAGWARSITSRGITMPTDVRDELLMIVAETRRSRNVTNNGTA